MKKRRRKKCTYDPNPNPEPSCMQVFSWIYIVGFMKKVSSVYTVLMNTIHLFLSTWGIILRKQTVFMYKHIYVQLQIEIYIRGVESFTISTINLSIHGAVIKNFSTNYMKALGLKQAYMFLKLRNNFYIVLICSIGSMMGNILQL